MLFEGASRARSPHDRRRVSRLFAGAAAVLLISTAISCGPSRSGAPTALGSGASSTPGTTRTPHVISIPTGNLDAFTQCMVDLGWQITAVHTPSTPGGITHYDMTHPNTGDFDQLSERSKQCEALRPPEPTQTDEEIRTIYYHWLEEYHCMVGLGYQPDPPPSVETFLATWNTGPWMPLDGIATEHWSQAQYDEAKAKCTLDMFSDDRYQ